MLTEIIEAVKLTEKRSVDRGASVIRDVKVLGLVSANGRRYAAGAVSRATNLYEGVAVNLDHAPSGTEGRRVADRFGALEGARFVENDGIRANLRFNPKHPQAEQVAWFAENMPSALGFSHVAKGRVSRRGGEVIVEEIVRVEHADLVADPATTKSLYESASSPPAPGTTKKESSSMKDLTLASLKEQRPDLVKALAAESDEQKALVKLAEEKKALELELDKLKLKEAVEAKKQLVESKIAEAKLPKAAVTDVFRRVLHEAKDEAEIKALIEDRKKLVASASPISSEQRLAEGATAPDVDAFLKSITL